MVKNIKMFAFLLVCMQLSRMHWTHWGGGRGGTRCDDVVCARWGGGGSPGQVNVKKNNKNIFGRNFVHSLHLK